MMAAVPFKIRFCRVVVTLIPGNYFPRDVVCGLVVGSFNSSGMRPLQQRIHVTENRIYYYKEKHTPYYYSGNPLHYRWGHTLPL